MQTNPFEASSDQIAHIARVTPFAMLGHLLNTTIAVIAFADAVPAKELIAWSIYSYSVALFLLYRRARRRGIRVGRNANAERAAKQATLYAVLLGLPWSGMAVRYLGDLSPHQELILVAIGVGMSASGSILLSAVPAAAYSYMSVILIPSAAKCAFLLDQSVYLFIGGLAISYWAFLAVLIGKVTRDITARRRAEEHRNLLVAELDHRVKNVLARVAAVVQRTREGSGSIDEFVDALDGRIHSMAGTHALLSRSLWQRVDLADLVRNDLAPYATSGNTTVAGPEIALNREAAEVMAMVLHELVTNAAKYGALSSPKGRVSVRWELPPIGSPASLRIEWREFDGPTVTAPNHAGYGTSLIRDLIPYELSGRVVLLFEPEGVCCKIEMPLAQALWSSKNDSTHSAAPA